MAKIMCRYFKLNGYYLVTNNKEIWKMMGEEKVNEQENS